jgi:hypothetical protein
VSAEVGDKIGDRLVLRGTFGPAFKNVAMLLYLALMTWWLGPSVVVMTGLVVWTYTIMLPTASIVMRVMICAAAFAACFWFYELNDQSGRFMTFGLLAGLVVVVLAAPIFGGAKLVADRKSVSITDLWMTRRFLWSDIVVERPKSKFGGVRLKPREISGTRAHEAGKKITFMLDDNYGLGKSDLFARLKRFSEAPAT